MSKPENQSLHTSSSFSLREFLGDDLPTFFEQQRDPDANYMAAFTKKNPDDADAFQLHWQRVLADKSVLIRTILDDNAIAGYVLSHGWFGEPEITYWLGKSFWGKGLATSALRAFLSIQTIRPLYARVVHDNYASKRVLEKCGFSVHSEGKGFANARGKEMREHILILNY